MKSKKEKIKKAKKLIKELETLELTEEEYKKVSGGKLIHSPDPCGAPWDYRGRL